MGRQVELVVYDDQASPEEAVKIATKLIEVDKVDVVGIRGQTCQCGCLQ